jgi:hypothetical protein
MMCLTRTSTVVDNKTQETVPVPPSSKSSLPQVTDTIVKHIHFVNEKHDVGLQLSRSDLPSTSTNSKSAQTCWTSTTIRSRGNHHLKSQDLSTIEDPSIDDLSIASYRPPPLYFNSHSDFLQMMTPATSKYIDNAKENRLSYLASIPIDSFTGELENDHTNDDDDNDNEHQVQQRSKRRSVHSVRFNLPSNVSASSTSLANNSRTQITSKRSLLENDFLKQFPLLRSLVEEALALQQQQQDTSIGLKRMLANSRPCSATQANQRTLQSNPTRPHSAANNRSIRQKSVIITRKSKDDGHRLYPPPPSTKHMSMTKAEMRHLVDRLSKQKWSKRTEKEVKNAEQMLFLEEPSLTPRVSSKSTAISVSTLVFCSIVKEEEKHCLQCFRLDTNDK